VTAALPRMMFVRAGCVLVVSYHAEQSACYACDRADVLRLVSFIWLPLSMACTLT
jgi:hypothetical protein